MGKFLRKHKEALLIATLGFFFVSLFVGVGSVIFDGADTREIVAKVGSARIRSKPFYANYRQALEAMRSRNPSLEVTPELEKSLKGDILRELIIRELFNMEARKWGMRVSPGEVARDIALRPAFQREGRFDPQAYYQFVIRTLGLLPKEFESERSQDLLSYKFRGVLIHGVAATENELRWLWQIENPAKTEKDWTKERAEFSERVYNEKMVALLNQYLGQLSQKNQIQTYLQ